ncbi:hypothetical protein BLAT2472_90276 [Burkholderia latens]
MRPGFAPGARVRGATDGRQPARREPGGLFFRANGRAPGARAVAVEDRYARSGGFRAPRRRA